MNTRWSISDLIIRISILKDFCLVLSRITKCQFLNNHYCINTSSVSADQVTCRYKSVLINPVKANWDPLLYELLKFGPLVFTRGSNLPNYCVALGRFVKIFLMVP